MAATVNGSVTIGPNGLQFNSGNLAQNQATLSGTPGNFNFPAYTYTYGTSATLTNGAFSCNQWYLNTLTIAGTGGEYDITLSGATDKDVFGVALAFTHITALVVSLSVCDFNANYVQIGPQSVSNAALLGFNASTDYWTLYGPMVFPCPAAGWVVNSTTAKLLPIVNNSAGSLNVQVFIAGYH